MPFRPTLPAVLAVAVFALAASPLAAQPDMAPWSPWGGPDSPGGLFGGDPQETMGDQDRPMGRAEIWSWLARRFDAADADRDGAVTADELKITPLETDRRAWFDRADADRDGRLTRDELQPLAGHIVQHHDTNGDGLLHRHEIQRRPAPGAQQPAATPPGR